LLCSNIIADKAAVVKQKGRKVPFMPEQGGKIILEIVVPDVFIRVEEE
jgi:hypothetical protein